MAEGDTQTQPLTQLLPNEGGCIDVNSLPWHEGEVAGNDGSPRPTREMVEEIRPTDGEGLTEDDAHSILASSAVLENDAVRPSIVTNNDDIVDEYRENLKQSFLRYNRPLNVLLIGQAGVGKTSFINSVICATNKQRGYWLNIGAGDRANVTSVLRRINICVPDEENQRFLEAAEEEDPTARKQRVQAKAPRLIDLSGLPDENNDVMRMLLRLLLYGHIPVETNLLEFHARGQQEGAAVLQHMFPQCHEHLIIDRVVVVCAANVNIPSDLTEAVMEAFQPLSYRHQLDGVSSKRAVPVFGLLTKQDLIETGESSMREDYDRRKKTLLDKLCLLGHEVKLGECQNYRYSEDDVEDSVHDPDIDMSVLRFMKVVCDTSHHISNPDFRLTPTGTGSPFWNLLPDKTTSVLMLALLIWEWWEYPQHALQFPVAGL